MKRRVAVCFWVALACPALSVRAEAGSGSASESGESGTPTERARLHFKLGVDFYRERNYRAALIEFKRAYAAQPHFKLLYNLGQASLELQEDANAIQYFSDYLAQGKDELSPDRRQEVEDTIKKLETRLASVTITTNEWGAEIYVDDTLIGRAPLEEPIRVSVGRRKFSAVKEGLPSAERIQDIAAGDRLSVNLEFEAKASQGEPVIAYREPVYADAAPTRPLPAAVWTGIATGVFTAGAVTMTLLTAFAQKNYKDELQIQTTPEKLKNLRDDAKRKALITDIAWGATLAAGAVTTVLLLTEGRASTSASSPAESSSARLHVDIGPTGAALQAEF